MHVLKVKYNCMSQIEVKSKWVCQNVNEPVSLSIKKIRVNSDSYRPISLIPNLWSILQTIVNQRIQLGLE